MVRPFLLAALCLAAVAGTPRASVAQVPDWRPPSREMPAMPRAAELQGDWLGPRSAWFRGLEGVAGVPASQLRAAGEPRGSQGAVQIARFTSGPLPVVVWSDRNGDGRSDMIEIFRSGGMIIQVIDPDYDGSGDVMRIYDADGGLVRQDRL